MTIFISLTITANVFANKKNAGNDFEDIFDAWTKAFNQKKYPEVCELFSKKIKADYQGVPRKNYSTICKGFQKIFQETEMTYQNQFKIHEVYQSNNLAAVRITWYLSVYKKGVHQYSIQEEGLDIFQKDDNNKWKIVNYIAYPVLN
ncbi:nuclear transport factor 2 family protein [Legionella israelensis]|uniref:Nuclear transport factor 2 family protein n=3 Tax=Legionella israelensis TaxID=454 RepID=A0AAX1EJT3_9GAMM|nr:nuclear transport factor 2 family protein [Legionella israelensis]